MNELVPVDGRWQTLKSLALKSVRSPHSIRAYDSALEDFKAWHEGTAEKAPLFSKAAVNAYRSSLEAEGKSSSTINVRLSAIRKLVSEASDNGLIDPQFANGISHIKGVPRRGTRLGNWLNRDQAEQLLNAPDPKTLSGKRDRALLGVLIGCGLRRSEACALTMEHIQQREGRWVIVDLVGKGQRVRSVAMPNWCKSTVDRWTHAAFISSGQVFRPLNKAGRITGSRFEGEKAIWRCVQKHAVAIGIPELAPHDLRRTYSKLAYAGRAALDQIQLSLGHASIQTTERYLGTQQDLSDAPCDHLGLRIQAA